MANNSKIEWTDSTWNVVTGCTKVSPGCKHCYAETFAERWRGVPGHPYEQGFDLRLWPERLELPLKWEKPRMIFVNSMSDLFHENVSLHYIQQVFEVMNEAARHTFQILTKRSRRLLKFNGDLSWTANIWQGFSVESEKYVSRIDDLRMTGANVKFLSVEPLLSPLPNLNLQGIHWLIVGGESGPGARPMKAEWALDIRDQCKKAGVPYFFKQWGGVNKKKAGRLLDGKEYNEMPL